MYISKNELFEKSQINVVQAADIGITRIINLLFLRITSTATDKTARKDVTHTSSLNKKVLKENNQCYTLSEKKI